MHRLRVMPGSIIVMRRSTFTMAILASAGIFALPALPAEADAVAIEANIVANHLPFGGIIDPVYDSPTGTTIVGYTRCADSALWTGAWLAAESYHYAVDQSPTALTNVKNAIAAIQGLVDVTGHNQLARCMFTPGWQFAAGVESEESASGNAINQAPPTWVWVGTTSRDEVVGVYFGLAVAYDLVNDPNVHASIGPIAHLIGGFISGNTFWSSDGSITTTFADRPEEADDVVDTTKHVNPGDGISGPLITVPFDSGVLVDVNGGNGSYFKFNLDYMSFFNLVRYNPNSSQDLGAYVDVRNYTANHQNPYFDMIDHALRGANDFDTEVQPLLDQWLLRPKRDLYVDNTKLVKNCSTGEACSPIPVPMRPTTDFLWQRDPFQLAGGGYDTIEGAGVDYVLPYWMGRYYGVIPAVTIQSAAAIQYNLATGLHRRDVRRESRRRQRSRPHPNHSRPFLVEHRSWWRMRPAINFRHRSSTHRPRKLTSWFRVEQRRGPQLSR